MAPDINVNIKSESGITGGDNVTTGDLTGDGIAVGRQAQAHSGGVSGYMYDIIADILRRLMEMERRILQLEVRDEWDRQRERVDRASVNTGWIAAVGAAITVALIILLIWFATGGPP